MPAHCLAGLRRARLAGEQMFAGTSPSVGLVPCVRTLDATLDIGMSPCIDRSFDYSKRSFWSEFQGSLWE